MSRSGTTWLGRCLNRHPAVCVIGETQFWGRQFEPPRREGGYTPAQLDAIVDRLAGPEFAARLDGMRTLRALDQQSAQGILTEAARACPTSPGALYRELCAAIAAAERKELVIEKTPHHVNWLDRLLSELPAARVVLTYRDPYEFMLSYKHQGDRQSAAKQEFFDILYHPLGCALAWRGYARAILRARHDHPDQTLVVDYAEIGAAPAAVLDRIQAFLGLARVELEAPADNSSFPNRARPRLAPDDVFWMNIVARREMEMLRFDRRRTPRRPLPIVRSLVRLPSWAWNVVALERDRQPGRSTARYLWRWLAPRAGGGAG